MGYQAAISLSRIIVFVVILFHPVSFAFAADLSRNTMVNLKSTREEAIELKYTEFCITQGDGYFPQPKNCHRYLTCTNLMEIERNCPFCLEEDAPQGKHCCGGRTCWNQTKVNEGVCEWCNDCKCSTGMD
ncbi:unnamed protein product [Orchesella dallaii]|uniref:Chitin-binding type-2 domain-containing protein n=1 Tax=Orchesella dallaii TaxID=48710 RepID=A0ABP1S0E9_9HEXA